MILDSVGEFGAEPLLELNACELLVGCFTLKKKDGLGWKAAHFRISSLTCTVCGGFPCVLVLLCRPSSFKQWKIMRWWREERKHGQRHPLPGSTFKTVSLHRSCKCAKCEKRLAQGVPSNLHCKCPKCDRGLFKRVPSFQFMVKPQVSRKLLLSIVISKWKPGLHGSTGLHRLYTGRILPILGLLLQRLRQDRGQEGFSGPELGGCLRGGPHVPRPSGGGPSLFFGLRANHMLWLYRGTRRKEAIWGVKT